MTIALALTLLMMAPAAAASPPAARADVPVGDAAFRTVSDREYAWRKTLTGPDEDSSASLNATLPDVGPAAQAAMTKRWTETMAALDRIDPATRVLAASASRCKNRACRPRPDPCPPRPV